MSEVASCPPVGSLAIASRPKKWLAAACLLALFGCKSQSPAVSPQPFIEGRTMGTTYMVRLRHAPSAERLDRLRVEVEEILEQINETMSNYIEDSELSRMNRAARDEPYRISPSLFEVLELSKRVSEQTDGAFDVSVAPLVRLWGFGPGAPDQPTPPSTAAIEGLLARVGSEHLSLNPDRSQVVKLVDDLEVDLSGIAKGFAVDRVGEHLRRRGYQDFLVEVGGELTAGGINADGVAWRVAIEAPSAGSQQAHRIVGLSEMAMATSGDYRNFYENDGKIYSHLIDPRHGRPVDHLLASVTVIHDSCAEADAFASGFLVMGPDEALARADRLGMKVLLQVRGENGELEERMSQAMTAYLDEAASGDDQR